jgi:hypothetical protein
LLLSKMIIVIAPYILAMSYHSYGGRKENMSTVVTEKTREPIEHPVTLEDVRHQVLTFGTQIHEYVNKVEANVEDYKFNVQKKGDGLEVEVEFKALIHPKSLASKIIPK